MEKKRQVSRYVYLAVGIALQLVLGILYLWSVFQPVVIREFGWSTVTASMTYSIMLAMFVVGNIIGGKIQDKYNPQITIAIGGTCLFVGTLLSGFVTAGNPFFLYMNFGVLAGFGIGAIYSTTIVTCQKWFPDKRGLATGLIVGALGFGGVIFTPLLSAWLDTVGIQMTFFLLAGIFGTVCLVAGFLFKAPDSAYTPEGYVRQNKINTGYTTKEMLKTKTFYILMFSMLLALPAFFMISPLIKVISVERGLTSAAATTGIMFTFVANSAGRLIGPWVSDKIGRKQTIIGLLAITIVSVILFIFAQNYFVIILGCVISFTYGGFLGVYPTVTTEYFGTKFAGLNYGLVLIGFGISAVIAPYISSMAQASGNLGISYGIAAAASLVSIILVLALKKPKRPITDN